MMLLWAAFGANWNLYQKVAFDGANRIIYVNEGVTEIDVQEDIYSAWKDWLVSDSDNTRFLQALTALGGDPITDTSSVGITYFLENGWRIQPRPSTDPYVLTVNGNIFTREPNQNPFLFAEGVSVSLTRSNLVDLIRVEALGVNITEQDIAAIAATSANSVWNALLADYVSGGTTGQKLGKIATKVQDIALR